jgi:hypothetical protein
MMEWQGLKAYVLQFKNFWAFDYLPLPLKMFRSSRTYKLLLVFYSFFSTFKVSCNFINLYQYIDISPPNYFVRMHADKLLFENLGPSKVPLTILAYNYNNPRDAWNSSITWSKFLPVCRILLDLEPRTR